MRPPSSKQPLYKHVAYFVTYHLGKGALSPLTGTDWRAWRAFVYLLECWTYSRSDEIVAALHATIRIAQPKLDVLQCFVQAIPAVGDWHDVAKLWPRIVGDLFLIDRQMDAREIPAIHRVELSNGTARCEHVGFQHGHAAVGS